MLSVKYVHMQLKSFVEQKCGMVHSLYLSCYEKSKKVKTQPPGVTLAGV
jgi:hypothetical protein